MRNISDPCLIRKQGSFLRNFVWMCTLHLITNTKRCELDDAISRMCLQFRLFQLDHFSRYVVAVWIADGMRLWYTGERAQSHPILKVLFLYFRSTEESYGSLVSYSSLVLGLVPERKPKVSNRLGVHHWSHVRWTWFCRRWLISQSPQYSAERKDHPVTTWCFSHPSGTATHVSVAPSW